MEMPNKATPQTTTKLQEWDHDPQLDRKRVQFFCLPSIHLGNMHVDLYTQHPANLQSPSTESTVITTSPTTHTATA